MKCLVLAAGYATRLYPLTKNFPKPLLEVNGKTIIDWLLDDIDKSGRINEYIIISNHKYYHNFEEWSKKKKLSSKITIIDDGTETNETRLGAVKDMELVINKLHIDEDLLVIAGDNLIDFSLNDFINYYDQKKSSCVMRYYEEDIERVKKSGSLKVDDNDLILEMKEKASFPPSNWCIPPFYLYSKDDVKMVSKALNDGCRIDSPGCYLEYLCQKSSVYAMKMPGKRYDIGTIENYEMVNKMFSNSK